MPIVLSMPPTVTSDNVFNVEVLVVSPAQGFDFSMRIMKAKIEDDMEIQPEGFGHQHYLLNEIALRASLALCYESIKYDNEQVRILCCVEDDIDYTTDVDTTLYPTEHRPVKYSGALYNELSDRVIVEPTPLWCESDVVDYDKRFFPQEFSELDEFAEPYLETIDATATGRCSRSAVRASRSTKTSFRVVQPAATTASRSSAPVAVPTCSS